MFGYLPYLLLTLSKNGSDVQLDSIAKININRHIQSSRSTYNVYTAYFIASHWMYEP